MQEGSLSLIQMANPSLPQLTASLRLSSFLRTTLHHQPKSVRMLVIAQISSFLSLALPSNSERGREFDIDQKRLKSGALEA